MHRMTALALVALATLACRSSPDEPESRTRAEPPATATQPGTHAKPPATPIPATAGGDPMKGRFSLAQATEGLNGTGTLTATIETDVGTLECELFEDKAPIAVANFAGLARGKRPFKGPGGTWQSKPAYDGTVFHRVVKGFMIQGGDWKKNGTGDAGYTFVDEVWPGATHDRRGQLCMANRGPNTNSMQFFVTDGPAKHLDGGFTIFGHCGPDAVIEKLASVPTSRDRAIKPTVIQHVRIARRPGDAPASAAPPSATPATSASSPRSE
jgi:peptidyl-prolyl cis-trans isomerase A (cyclophilin A)